MPTYQYRRPDGSTFEVFQKISEPALTVDPDTGDPVQRVISGGAGLQFKGSGFYLTDYGRAGSPPKKDGGSSSDKPSGGTSESKSESTPAKIETKAAPASSSSASGD